MLSRATSSLAGLALLLTGCTYWEPYPRPAPAVPDLPSTLRVASDSEASVLLIDPFLRGDTLFGRVDREEVGFPVNQLHRLERQRVHGLRSVGLVTGVSVALIVAALYSGGLE
jgi:hypothetical protein